MQNVIGIICEYNPFHKGHKYQIDQIRNEIPDATIIAIMSGNIVQRGEFSIMDKYERAKIALECGIDAVFEMPYPYSGSTAEIFANAGVTIAKELGCSYLYFGIEDESIDKLEKTADAINSDAFEKEIKEAISDKKNSYIASRQIALNRLGLSIPKSANDMLAVEYIRAIKRKNISIKYRAIKRVGACYNSIEKCDIMSATAIRKHYYENGSFISVPSPAESSYKEICKENRCLSMEQFNRFIHAYTLLNLSKIDTAFDTTPEMSAIIKKASKESKNSGEFIEALSSKLYTVARLKRALLYTVFNIKSVDFSPKFTILLGANAKGRDYLRKHKKRNSFYIITKHSESKYMSKTVKKQLELVYSVDELYNILLCNQKNASAAYKNKPLIK